MIICSKTLNLCTLRLDKTLSMWYNYTIQENITSVRSEKLKLTQEESKIVEDNHNLIYWVANKLNLDLEEWYGLLAIELCIAVKKHKPEKGSLSNYYLLRCRGLRYKEIKKLQSLKNEHISINYIEGMYPCTDYGSIEENYEINEWLNNDKYGILEMKADGYTQKEIAKELGVSQSYVSKVLKKIREEYYDSDG
jgi:RNA polymerase sigma factor (sigma-70 family)